MTPPRQPLSAFHALLGVRGHTSIVCLSLPLWILYSITWTELSAKPTVIQGEPNMFRYSLVTKPTVAPTLNPCCMTFQTYEYKNTKAYCQPLLCVHWSKKVHAALLSKGGKCFHRAKATESRLWRVVFQKGHCWPPIFGRLDQATQSASTHWQRDAAKRGHRNRWEMIMLPPGQGYRLWRVVFQKSPEYGHWPLLTSYFWKVGPGNTKRFNSLTTWCSQAGPQKCDNG